MFRWENGGTEMYFELPKERRTEFDRWISDREAELLLLAKEVVERGSQMLEDLMGRTVRREFGRSSPELHRGYYTRNPAMHACIENVHRGRILKRNPRKMAGIFEYLFDVEDRMVGYIHHPMDGGLMQVVAILRRGSVEYDLDCAKIGNELKLNCIWRYDLEAGRTDTELVYEVSLQRANWLTHFLYAGEELREAHFFQCLGATMEGVDDEILAMICGTGQSVAAQRTAMRTLRYQYLRCLLRRDADGEFVKGWED